MAGTKQVSVSSLKPGNYIIIDNIACKVNKIDVSRPGKHGHAKCRVDASNLIDGSRKVVVLPGHDKINVPIVEKKGAQILSIQGEIANVMDEKTYETFDLKVPSELKDQVSEGKKIIYWEILDQKIMKMVR